MTIESSSFAASRLGTKKYWDDIYSRDLTNFHDFGDIGEIWFGEESEDLMLEWIRENMDLDAPILEVGCGNGHLLTQLAIEHDFTNLTGWDYSEKAIQLARNIAAEAEAEGASRIEYQTVDLLNDNQQQRHQPAFQLVLDKGTFDAISLSPVSEDDDTNERDLGVIEKYVLAVARCLAGCDGLLLITSCNWTAEELATHFKSHFQLKQKIKSRAPSFSFGGVEGDTCSAVLFQLHVNNRST